MPKKKTHLARDVSERKVTMMVRGAIYTLADNVTDIHPRTSTRWGPSRKKSVNNRIEPNPIMSRTRLSLIALSCKTNIYKIINVSISYWFNLWELLHTYPSLFGCKNDINGDVYSLDETANGIDGDEKSLIWFESCIIDP